VLSKREIVNGIRDNKGLLAQYGVKKIGLFGSFSKNLQHPDSDIDLLVDFHADKETFDNLIAIYDILENIFKHNKIEIATKNGLSKYIGPYILKETEYV